MCLCTPYSLNVNNTPEVKHALTKKLVTIFISMEDFTLEMTKKTSVVHRIQTIRIQI